jgi:hypothetical protein
MALIEQSGVYNQATNKVYAASTSTWGGLTSWDTWNEWAYSTEDQIVWYLNPIFLGGQARNVTLNISTVADGVVGYRVYTSMTGEFGGEETETVIDFGDQDIPSFYARVIQIAVVVDRIIANPTFSSAEVTTSDSAVEIKLSNIDTSTLGGTQTARELVLPQAISRIVDMNITPQEVTAYNLDVYVTNTATSTYLIPKIIDKDPVTPVIALVGVDNHPRDGVVDIVIKALPSQNMVGNNLVTT